MNWEYFDYAFAGSAMHIAYHISSQNKNFETFKIIHFLTRIDRM